MIGEIALGFAGDAAFGELIDETGHEAAQEGVAGSWRGRRIETLLLRGVHDLLEGLLHLAGDLGIDAVAAAAVEAEGVRFGEVVSSHERDEIGVGAVLEHLACGLGADVIAVEPGEEVATAHQSSAEGGIGHAAALAGLDEHA